MRQTQTSHASGVPNYVASSSVIDAPSVTRPVRDRSRRLLSVRYLISKFLDIIYIALLVAIFFTMLTLIAAFGI